MDLELSDDQLELQSNVRTVLERECPMSLVRAVVEEGKGADELWSRMVELDWPALVVPEEFGGVGLGIVEMAVVAEELGRAVAPGPLLATVSQFVPMVRIAGDAGQRAHFLGEVVCAGRPGTLAFAEADGRYRLGSTQATATPVSQSPAAGGFMISGEKHFVYDADSAAEIIVIARLPGSSGEQGIGAFVVPQSEVEIVPMSNLDASRQYSAVRLNRVLVDRDRVLGEPGSDATLTAIGLALQESVVALSAEAVGTCQAAFDVVHAYVNEREQFGVKIGSFQAIKHKLSNMFVALESARALTYFAAAAVAEDDERRHLAVSMAKAGTGDCQKLIATEAIQCLGGIGYTWEHDMHLYVKHLKAQAASFGTAAEHRALVAELIGL